MRLTFTRITLVKYQLIESSTVFSSPSRMSLGLQDSSGIFGSIYQKHQKSVLSTSNCTVFGTIALSSCYMSMHPLELLFILKTYQSLLLKPWLLIRTCYHYSGIRRCMYRWLWTGLRYERQWSGYLHNELYWRHKS